MNKKVLDPDTEAAVSIVEMEQTREQIKEAEQKKREVLIAQCHEVIGRIQGVKMLVKFGDVASLVWLRDAKEQKIYNDLPSIGTWDKFCEYIGYREEKLMKICRI